MPCFDDAKKNCCDIGDALTISISIGLPMFNKPPHHEMDKCERIRDFRGRDGKDIESDLKDEMKSDSREENKDLDYLKQCNKKDENDKKDKWF